MVRSVLFQLYHGDLQILFCLSFIKELYGINSSILQTVLSWETSQSTPMVTKHFRVESRMFLLNTFACIPTIQIPVYDLLLQNY